MPTKATKIADKLIKSDDDVYYEGGKAAKGKGKDKPKGKKNTDIRVSSRLSKRTVKASDDLTLDGVPLLQENKEMFEDLTFRKYFKTDLNIISMVVSYDSKYVISISSTNDDEFRVRGFSLATFEPIWTHKFLGHVDPSLDA